MADETANYQIQKSPGDAILAHIEKRLTVGAELKAAPSHQLTIVPRESRSKICIGLIDLSSSGGTQPTNRVLTVTDGTTVQVFAWGTGNPRTIAGDEVFVGARGATVTLTLAGTSGETDDYCNVGWQEL